MNYKDSELIKIIIKHFDPESKKTDEQLQDFVDEAEDAIVSDTGIILGNSEGYFERDKRTLDIIIQVCQETCEDEYNTPLNIRTRKREVVESRQFYFHFAKKLTKQNLAIIGKTVCPDYPFDHATVLHGIRTIDNITTTDPAKKEKLLNIERIILERLQ